LQHAFQQKMRLCCLRVNLATHCILKKTMVIF
jgi:hypothetical protein